MNKNSYLLGFMVNCLVLLSINAAPAVTKPKTKATTPAAKPQPTTKTVVAGKVSTPTVVTPKATTSAVSASQLALQQEQVKFKALLDPILALDITKADDNALINATTILGQAVTKEYLGNIGIKKTDAANKLAVVQQEQASRLKFKPQLDQALTLDVTKVDDSTLVSVIAILSQAAVKDYLGTKKNEAVGKLTVAQQEQARRKAAAAAQAAAVAQAAAAQAAAAQAAAAQAATAAQTAQVVSVAPVASVQTASVSTVPTPVAAPVAINATQTKAALDKAIKGTCFIKLDKNHVSLSASGLEFTVDASKGYPFMLVPVIDTAPRVGTITYIIVPTKLQNALCVANENGKLVLHNYIIGSPVEKTESWDQMTGLRYPDDKLRNSGMTLGSKLVATP